MKQHGATRWVSMAALVLALAAIGIALIGMTLARYDMIGKLPGFQAFLYMIPVAGIAALVGVFAFFMNMRTGWPHVGKALVAIVVGGGGALAATLAMSAAGEVPFIHDITTDLEDPPAYTALTVPEDNLRGTEGVEDWKITHREGYPDIQPIVVASSPAQVVARAEELARERGWTVALSDPEAGLFEATAYESYIRFEDIVALRAREVEGGTRVDMRSLSLVGQSDLGVNARRIREFLAALQAAG